MKQRKTQPYEAALIRAAMAAQRKTVEQLAEETGISAPTLSKVRAGKNVQVSTLRAVCEALGLEVKIIERRAA